MTNRDYFAWSYPAEKFDEAVRMLAVSFAPGWQRMESAMMNFIALLPAHFPDQRLYQRYRKLWDHANSAGPFELHGRQIWGSLEHTLRRRRRTTLKRYAEEILAIHDEIEKLRGDYEPSWPPSQR